MPLEILVPFVVLAVAAIMLVIVRSGLSKQAAIASAEAARRRFRIDYPAADIACVLIDDDRKTALLAMRNSGEAGLVLAFGDRTVTRLLTPGDVRSMAAGNAGFTLRFDDFTAPVLAIALAGDGDRAVWRAILEPLTGAPATREAAA